MGAGRFSETSADTYQSTWRHITESIYLKSHMKLIYEYYIYKLFTAWKRVCLS